MSERPWAEWYLNLVAADPDPEEAILGLRARNDQVRARLDEAVEHLEELPPADKLDALMETSLNGVTQGIFKAKRSGDAERLREARAAFERVRSGLDQIDQAIASGALFDVKGTLVAMQEDVEKGWAE